MSNTWFWMLWDCSDCGETRISGKHKVCPRCGEPQNSVLTPSEDWYASDSQTPVNDPDELTQLNAGPAWNCGHCGTLNDGNVTQCSHCDRRLDFDDTVNRETTYDDHASHYDERIDPLDERIESDLDRAQRALDTEASGPRVMEDLTRPESELPRTGSDTEFYEDIRRQVHANAAERERIRSLTPAKQFLYRNKRSVAITAAVVAVLLVIGIVTGVVKFVQHQTATVSGVVTVAELHWERSVEVEEYKTLTQADWNHPSDARVQASERKIRRWQTIHDGWRTEWYTEIERRPRTETYPGTESRPRTETYSGTCTRSVTGGNGAMRTETYSCPKTRTVYDQVPVIKTRTVYDSVPVRKSRQVEITHQEPVWNIWYTYQVDRWETDRWVVKTDTPDTPKPSWPQVTDLSQNGTPGDQVGEERVGDDRTQRYTIIYTDSRGERHTENGQSEALWSKLEKGETVPASYRAKTGNLVTVDWNAAS